MVYSLRLAFFALLVTFASLTSVAAEVGNVRLVKIWAFTKPPAAQDWKDLFRRDPVEMDQRLRTPEGGALHVRFIDETDLRLGSAAEVQIDRFVYNPATGAGTLQAEMGKGVFRFISGRMAKDGVRLGTPSAFIGIRGTDFIVDVRDDGSTVVAVLEGEVVITPRTGGAAVSVMANQTALVAANTTSVQIGVTAATADSGIDEDGGIDGSPNGPGSEGESGTGNQD